MSLLLAESRGSMLLHGGGGRLEGKFAVTKTQIIFTQHQFVDNNDIPALLHRVQRVSYRESNLNHGYPFFATTHAIEIDRHANNPQEKKNISVGH